jgi:hypothetical protein
VLQKIHLLSMVAFIRMFSVNRKERITKMKVTTKATRAVLLIEEPKAHVFGMLQGWAFDALMKKKFKKEPLIKIEKQLIKWHKNPDRNSAPVMVKVFSEVFDHKLQQMFS